jgi:flagellar L-ring protein precursor FlgH
VKGRLIALVLLAGVSLATTTVSADDIWERRIPNGAYLFVDNRARKVGDLLTIVIHELTNIENREQRDNEKKTQAQAIFNWKGDTTGNIATKTSSADFNANLQSDRSLNGKAQYTSDRTFTDNITATVIQVLPNGNLVLEGSRDVILQGELRTMKITGIARPMDIGAGNMIESRFVGNFQVSYKGKGIESSYTQQGWMSRMWNYLWPF